MLESISPDDMQASARHCAKRGPCGIAVPSGRPIDKPWYKEDRQTYAEQQKGTVKLAVKVVAYGIPGGNERVDIGTFESVQMTCDDLRDDNDNMILHYYAPDMTWFDATGNGWYDWTIEAVNG